MGMLAGKGAVVMGGSSGLGRACAERFATEGARVVVAARRLDELQTVAKAVGGLAVACDITRDEDVAALVERARAELGRIDIALNCAGFEQSTLIRDLTPERLLPMVAVQLLGPIALLRRVANAMAEDGGGSIVLMSSITATLPGHGLAAYAGAKAGLNHIARIAALEYGPQGVRVNCVSPALIETPMTAYMFRAPGVVAAFVEETPLGRMGTVEDVVNAVLWLASDASAYVTGQNILVDGGLATRRLPTRAQIARHAAAPSAQ